MPLLDFINGNARELKGDEYNGALHIYQEVWSELNNRPASEAPSMYLHETEMANAYYRKTDNSFGVYRGLLEIANEEELRALFYHEVGHQVLGHGRDERPFWERYVDSGNHSHRQEFSADSISAAHCYGDAQASLLEKIRHHNADLRARKIRNDEWLPDWIKDKIDASAREDHDSHSHPSNARRSHYLNHVGAMYCNPENPDSPIVSESVPLTEQKGFWARLWQKETKPFKSMIAGIKSIFAIDRLSSALDEGDIEAVRKEVFKIGENFDKSPEELRKLLEQKRPQMEKVFREKGMSPKEIDEKIDLFFSGKPLSTSPGHSPEKENHTLCTEVQIQIDDCHAEILTNFQQSCGEYMTNSCNIQIPSPSLVVETSHFTTQQTHEAVACR